MPEKRTRSPGSITSAKDQPNKLCRTPDPIQQFSPSHTSQFDQVMSVADVQRVNIEPTPAEEHLFDIIRETCKELGKGTIARVAGGWVRDRLLGRPNDDIDFAIDNMSGVEFAKAVKAHVERVDHQSVKVAVIKANPEQSKHLETATMNLAGFEIDMVNLRTETYTGNSRIPTVALGTPEEDAMRRDFTINALFYNINDRLIEDFTGQGLQDLLITKVIRTPLNPKDTFHDDPLRILRAVRFAVRFHYRLHDSILDAASDPETRDALQRKVSRERVGKELEGMLSGNHAYFPNVLEFLYEMDLLSIVFNANPRNDANGSPVEMTRLNHRSILNTALWAHWLSTKSELFGETTDPADRQVRLTQLASTQLFFRGHQVQLKKFKFASLVSMVITESLKFKTKDATDCTALVESLGPIQALLDLHDKFKRGEVAVETVRLEVALFLRSLKTLWRPALLLAFASQLEHYCRPHGERQQPIIAYMTLHEALMKSGSSRDQADSAVVEIGQSTFFRSMRTMYPCDHVKVDSMEIIEQEQRYASLVAMINELQLDSIWDLKGFMKGQELAEILELPRGPLLGKIVEEQWKWQVQYPAGTREECIEALKGVAPRLIDEAEKKVEGQTK